MDLTSITSALAGGSLIGLSATLMLLFNGRITGISGIIASSLNRTNSANPWRLSFLSGMILTGAAMTFLRPDLFVNLTQRSHALIIIAGFLVGYGTLLGSGCTSGHGICGISRLSTRSLVATGLFMLTAFLTVIAIDLLTGAFA